MCGWTSGLTLLYLVANSPDLEFKKISYCNSGDSKFGSKDEVVGYNAIVLIDRRTVRVMISNKGNQDGRV